jgi:hypothetical protein
MISLLDLDKISLTLARAKATLIDDEIEKARVLNLPFGGLHVVFCGDLYQLPPPGGFPVYTSNPRQDKEAALRGRAIWKSINEYVRLVKNHRVKHNMKRCVCQQERDVEEWFATTLSRIRQCDIDQDTINFFNSRSLVNSRSSTNGVHEVRNSFVILLDSHIHPISNYYYN